eukprot:GILJ01005433.1.p1 GENE.GILJ01005433.1~~GILJ01005433.1.p1  ORF type:complete len:226 (+),score=8.72 GILJ01005433.1:60-680(+)
MSIQRRTPVILNVYDLSTFNNFAHSIGMGAYHTGIEINGTEYSFGGHDLEGTGVFEIDPRTAPQCRFRESVRLGETTLTRTEILRVVSDLQLEFQGRNYHVLSRNCNTFTNVLAKRLLGKGIPSYVNRLASFGKPFSCFMPSTGASNTPYVPPTQTTQPRIYSAPSSIPVSTTRRTGELSAEERERRDKMFHAASSRLSSNSAPYA